jgi:hypothetical protein
VERCEAPISHQHEPSFNDQHKVSISARKRMALLPSPGLWKLVDAELASFFILVFFVDNGWEWRRDQECSRSVLDGFKVFCGSASGTRSLSNGVLGLDYGCVVCLPLQSRGFPLLGGMQQSGFEFGGQGTVEARCLHTCDGIVGIRRKRGTALSV